MKKNIFLERLRTYCEDGIIEKKYCDIIKAFYDSYSSEVSEPEKYADLFLFFLERVREQLKSPHEFEPYHQKIRSPHDYYQFGIDFIAPLVETGSKVLGLENIEEIKHRLANNENVILLANHQTESDPQAISVLLKDTYPELASKIIYVAGERVITDPLAIPFSIGCDLLCIYSKKYISNPPEEKHDKQLHNKKTMEYMSSLLKEGGKIIYVAPSGGRDRPNENGEIEVASFDAQSIEMFLLMAKKSKTKTHFYPLALMTYNLLPPPDKIQIELGENRKTQKGKIFGSFGKELNMVSYPGSDAIDKISKRKNRATYIYNIVKQAYNHLRSL